MSGKTVGRVKKLWKTLKRVFIFVAELWIYAGSRKVNQARGLGQTYKMSFKMASKMAAQLSFQVFIEFTGFFWTICIQRVSKQIGVQSSKVKFRKKPGYNQNDFYIILKLYDSVF